MEKERFIALGRELGLENAELREWVERERAQARDERAKEREVAKENAERQQKLLEQQQKVQEQELKILELKLRLQETLRIFLKERSCKTLSSLCETADNFMEAQALTNLGKERIPKEPGPSVSKSEAAKKMEKPASRCFLCDKAGHRAADCWSRTKGNTSSRCGVCEKSGRSSDRCPSREFGKDQASCMLSATREAFTPEQQGRGYVVLQDGETIPIVNATLSRRSETVGVTDMPVVKGFLENRPVHVLRDTGCNTVVVRQSLVPKEKFTGPTSPVYLLDRTKVPGDLAAFQASSMGKKSSEFLHGNALEESPEPDKELEKAKKPQKGYYGKKVQQT
ncbi:hypothetical protein HPB52_016495 [Rhipicephalus sanguineus]|uniref:CCHC-type domain-containing protein n=1 Tax=Rhipicephalus sanguineus TaxID=34632 RepID=A0A9D4PK77_RHISA|nr:hypothetical protein HPB52_016495 [Rhipicephalus sanguineus]